jgi:hypothetical protein
MAQLDEERALRSAMTDLLADQPQQPADRLAAVRRRHTRRRAFQVGGTALTVVVALLAGLLAGGVVGRKAVEPLNRDVPSWALPWSDHRDEAVTKRMLDGAVARWRTDENGNELPAPQRVIWYAAKIVAHTAYLVVVFEADVDGEHRLVTGVTPLDVSRQWRRDRGRRMPPFWRLYDVAAPAPSYSGIIGVNFGDYGAHNSVVLLAPPSAQLIRWTAPGAGSGTVELDDGFGTVDMDPPPRGPVQAAIVSPSPGGEPDYEPVGVPGAPESRFGQLADPAPLVGVGSSLLLEASGQGERGRSNASERAQRATATTIYARCYGPVPMHVAVAGDDRAGTEVGIRIPCDDRQHVVAGPSLASTGSRQGSLWVFVHARYDVAWRVAVTSGDAA